MDLGTQAIPEQCLELSLTAHHMDCGLATGTPWYGMLFFGLAERCDA